MAIHRDQRHSEPLFLIVCGSIVANCLLWYGLSQGANQVTPQVSLPELVVDRVNVEKPRPKEPQNVVIKTVPPKPPPKVPLPKPPPPVTVRVLEKTSPLSRPRQTPPRPGAHNHVLLAQSSPKAPAPPSDFHALSGGKAKVGVTANGQNPGDSATNPDHPAPVSAPPVPPTPPTSASESKHNDAPATLPTPRPPVSEAKQADPPPPPPKPKGPTQDAIPSHQINPEIPESLKSQTFKSFVRVKVSISEDGSFAVTLRTSSGNSEIDKLVLDALNRWKWKPALKNGEPVDSVQLFRFDFSVD